MLRTIAAVALLAPVSSALAQTYVFTIDSKQSSVATSLAVEAPLTGTFIGDFDATNNPGGTKTIPGPFGGSGNNPIGYSATLSAGGDVESPPSGGFTVQVNLDSQTVLVNGLAIDLLGGEQFAIGVTLTILYSTFHTQQPTAIFLGGFELPIPLGDVVEVNALTAAQNGAGAGALVELEPGKYTFTALVPVDITAEILVQGSPAGDGAPIPALLPIVGTLDLTLRQPTLVATAVNSIAETQPIDPPVAFENQALDVPTIFPPGGTAHLLFGGALASIDFAFDSDVTLVAVGDLLCVAADLNCDGVVDGADLGILLGAWGTPGPGDLNGDGTVDGADMGLLLAAWS